jgi:hypothetical protein
MPHAADVTRELCRWVAEVLAGCALLPERQIIVEAMRQRQHLITRDIDAYISEFEVCFFPSFTFLRLSIRVIGRRRPGSHRETYFPSA